MHLQMDWLSILFQDGLFCNLYHAISDLFDDFFAYEQYGYP